MNIEHHQETIECPSCSKIQVAIVQPTHPWWTYIHVCGCGHIIMESEWEVVNLTPELEKRL